MKSKQVWRYYCDFCKKSGGSKHHMEAHEKRCVANPGRVCGMCRALEQEQPEMQTLLDALPMLHESAVSDFLVGTAYDAPDLTKLRKAAGDCPVCMLAALKQRGFTAIFGKEVFDYQKEVSSVWHDHNAE